MNQLIGKLLSPFHLVFPHGESKMNKEKKVKQKSL